jgi:hypothetical protein
VSLYLPPTSLQIAQAPLDDTTFVLADNILVSNDFSRHLDSLIAVSREASPLPRVFAYLVMRHLLARLSGESQIEAAHRVLVAIPRENMAAMLLSAPDLPTLENVGS